MEFVKSMVRQIHEQTVHSPVTMTLIFLTSGGCVATWHLYRPESLGDAYCICNLQLLGYLKDQTDRKFNLPAIDVIDRQRHFQPSGTCVIRVETIGKLSWKVEAP